MTKHPERDTREHILCTGEALCLHRGFTGLGLSELLKTADVPKGSFYHYFRSKEAFGVAMLERYYAEYNNRLASHFTCASNIPAGDRVIQWFDNTLTQFRTQQAVNGCLAVKLSAEVCDLSEDMRTALECGSRKVITWLGDALARAREENSAQFDGSPHELAQVLYALWLGANLQAKTTRSALPLEAAIAHVRSLIHQAVR